MLAPQHLIQAHPPPHREAEGKPEPPQPTGKGEKEHHQGEPARSVPGGKAFAARTALIGGVAAFEHALTGIASAERLQLLRAIDVRKAFRPSKQQGNEREAARQQKAASAQAGGKPEPPPDQRPRDAADAEDDEQSLGAFVKYPCQMPVQIGGNEPLMCCLLYTSDAADDV